MTTSPRIEATSSRIPTKDNPGRRDRMLALSILATMIVMVWYGSARLPYRFTTTRENFLFDAFWDSKGKTEVELIAALGYPLWVQATKYELVIGNVGSKSATRNPFIDLILFVPDSAGIHRTLREQIISSSGLFSRDTLVLPTGTSIDDAMEMLRQSKVTRSSRETWLYSHPMRTGRLEGDVGVTARLDLVNGRATNLRTEILMAVDVMIAKVIGF